MARHIFKPWPAGSAVQSISLCGRVFSTREAQAATDGQHGRDGDCRDCRRKQEESARMAGRTGVCASGEERDDGSSD